MTINDYIDDFLRDAQYRVGVLSVEIDQIGDDGSYRYSELFDKRLQLTTFMDIVYEGKWYITSGYNHIQYTATSGTTTGWTEREVIQEIEYLRYYCEMNEVPFINFTGHYPQIVNLIGSGGSGSVGLGNLPAGQYGQFIGYNAGGIPEAQDFDEWGGHIDGETITAYFSGRL